MIFNVDTITKFIGNYFVSNKSQVSVYQDPRRYETMVNFSTSEPIELHKHRDNPNDAIHSCIATLKDNILANKMFDNERKQLEEYQELKNLEFVLDKLKNINIENLTKSVKHDKFSFENEQLNSYLGRTKWKDSKKY